MVIQTSSIFGGDNPEGSVPNIGAKWFLGYNSTLGWVEVEENVRCVF